MFKPIILGFILNLAVAHQNKKMNKLVLCIGQKTVLNQMIGILLTFPLKTNYISVSCTHYRNIQYIAYAKIQTKNDGEHYLHR